MGCKFIFDLGLLRRGLILKTTLSSITAELSSKRCRRSFLNSSEKKRRKVANSKKQNVSRIYIGSCLQQWKRLLKNGNFKNDCAFATYLLELYEKRTAGRTANTIHADDNERNMLVLLFLPFKCTMFV